MSFGDHLRRIRESKGMTVNQLAMYSGISGASISRYETGERGTPKPPTIEKLAKGLKVDYTQLMRIAGHLKEEPDTETEKDAVDKLNEYLDLELTDEEIIQRMNFKVDNLILSKEEVKEFIAFVRYNRVKKTEQAALSKHEEP